MKCTVTLGYFGRILLTLEDGRSAMFAPSKRTLTGAKHRNGRLRCMTAAEVRKFLGITGLRNPHDTMELENDRGIFDLVSAVELDMHAQMCYNRIPLPLSTVAAAARLRRKE